MLFDLQSQKDEDTNATKTMFPAPIRTGRAPWHNINLVFYCDILNLLLDTVLQISSTYFFFLGASKRWEESADVHLQQ